VAIDRFADLFQGGLHLLPGVIIQAQDQAQAELDVGGKGSGMEDSGAIPSWFNTNAVAPSVRLGASCR
jgi:hypothetical protein